MKYQSIILGTALVASVLAAPATPNNGLKNRQPSEEFKQKFQAMRNESRVKRRAEKAAAKAKRDIEGTSHNVQGLEWDPTKQVSYSSNWCGAVLTSTGYDEVVGTWTTPTDLKNPNGGETGTYYISEWVGIDGDTCGSAIWQAGTVSEVSGGTQSAYAWHEWYPKAEVEFLAFDVSPGDTVTFTLTANSTSEGYVVVENTSTGKSTSISVDSPRAATDLCEYDAEWILEDFESGSSLVSLADFGSASITDIAVHKNGASASVSGAGIIDIRQSGSVLCKASLSGTTVDFTYSG